MSKSLAPNVSGCIYKSIIISDHALLLLKYSAKTTVKGKTLRRLKPQWLQNPKFLEYVGQNIDDCFLLNTTETSIGDNYTDVWTTGILKDDHWHSEG